MKGQQLAVIDVIQSDYDIPSSKKANQFKKLIKQIYSKRENLSLWREAVCEYNRKYESEILPLVERLDSLKEEFVYALDKIYSNKKLNKLEKRKTKDLICNIISDLQKTETDENLKGLYYKYNGSSFDQDEQEAYDDFREMAKEMFDIDLDEEMGSVEDMFSDISGKMCYKFSQEHDSSEEKVEQFKSTKKSSQEVKREEKAKKNEQESASLVRSIYLNLATILHPDREKDEKEKERKTELMQRINVAYNKRDLFSLLEIQKQVEQVSSEISEKQSAAYNKILKSELKKLSSEILFIKQAFSMEFDIQYSMLNSPQILMLNISYEERNISDQIEFMKKEFKMLEDILEFKKFLRNCY